MAGIYVELPVRCELETLWQRTQDPALHVLWDLRFTEITYLPREDEGPQRFRYATRIGFGLAIAGSGETVGEARDTVSGRSSSLRFASDHPLSLIVTGSGYWRYVPMEDGAIRFLTWYDYRVRWGLLGRLVDRLCFRPLMGWATAWSFDRLRLWIERGQHPGTSLRLGLGYLLARGTVALVWAWHGLVPKLLVAHEDEARPFLAAGFSPELTGNLVRLAGGLELAMALAVVLGWRWRWPLWLTIVGMAAAVVGVAATVPAMFLQAFNPLTFSIAVAALAAIAVALHDAVPRATRCRRHRPREEGTT